MEILLNVLTIKSQMKKTKWGNMFQTQYEEVQAILAFKISCFYRVFKVSSFTQRTITAVWYNSWQGCPEVSNHNCLGRHLTNLLYILESNPHPFYSFRGLKNQMWIRIACELDSQSWAGFWKNDRASVRAVRTIQYNIIIYYFIYYL